MTQLFLGNKLRTEHTLFKASTGIFCAFMSLRSRSASYFRSLDMLNLRAEHKKKGIHLSVQLSFTQQAPPCLRRPDIWYLTDSEPQQFLPQCFLSSLKEVLQDDSCHGAPLSNTGTISNQEARPLVVLKDHLMLLKDQGKGDVGRINTLIISLLGFAFSCQHLAGIDDSF